MESVIFPIDNCSDLHTLAKFTRHLDTQRAMGNLVGDVKLCIGLYNGCLEYSFHMLVVDFDKHVRDTVYVKDQETFLFLSSDPRQPAELRSPDGQFRQVLNPPSVGGTDNTPWTYDLRTNSYFSC